jgi:hypothetical protein
MKDNCVIDKTQPKSTQLMSILDGYHNYIAEDLNDYEGDLHNWINQQATDREQSQIRANKRDSTNSCLDLELDNNDTEQDYFRIASDPQVEVNEGAYFVRKPILKEEAWTDAEIKAVEDRVKIKWHQDVIILHGGDDTVNLLLQQHMERMDLPEGDVYKINMPNHTTVEQVVQFLQRENTEPTMAGVNIIHSIANDIQSFLLATVFVHDNVSQASTPQHAKIGDQNEQTRDKKAVSNFKYIQRHGYPRGDWNTYSSGYFLEYLFLWIYVHFIMIHWYHLITTNSYL